MTRFLRIFSISTNIIMYKRIDQILNKRKQKATSSAIDIDTCKLK
jgi:hypothetical protein